MYQLIYQSLVSVLGFILKMLRKGKADIKINIEAKAETDNIMKKKDYNKINFRNKDVDKFGMLSVKAGIDNNPKITHADKIAGAKMNKNK